MRIIVEDNPTKADETAALLLISQLIEKPDSVIGTAVGSTTAGIHTAVLKHYKKGLVSFKDAYLFCKDADLPVGVSTQPKAADNPRSQYSILYNKLVKHTDLPITNFFTPDPLNKNPHNAMVEFINLIESLGGIDLLFVAVGQPGYIGFNYPGLPFNNDFTIIDTKEKLDIFLPFYGEDSLPSLGLSLGINKLLTAKRIILCAKGPDKAEIIAKAINEPNTQEVPASFIQLHENTTVILDVAAASKL